MTARRRWGIGKQRIHQYMCNVGVEPKTFYDGEMGVEYGWGIKRDKNVIHQSNKQTNDINK